MTHYFVAKSPQTGFVGQLTRAQILEQRSQGAIGDSFVVTESTGPSYAELIKAGGAEWITVAAFLSQTAGSVDDAASDSAAPDPSSVSTRATNRYRDGYLVGRAIDGIGSFVKAIGLILGVLVALGTMVGGSGTLGAASLPIGLLLGLIVACPLYVLGVLVSSSGQMLKASLDAAVHTSRFLTDAQRMKVMSLA